MPLGAYRVSDLPNRGAEAFLPPPPPVCVPATLSSFGLVVAIGAPGTAEIDSHQPPVTAVPISLDRKTQRGWVDPDEFPNAPLPGAMGTRDRDTWSPAIYVALPDNMGPQAGAAGVRVRHYEDLPVPAIDFHRYTTPVQRTPPYLAGRVTPWPRVFSRFNSVLGPPTGTP